jgi:O-antigen ligase
VIAVELVRTAASITCAGGLLALLAAGRRIRPPVALWVVLVGWLVTAASLAPPGRRWTAMLAVAAVAGLLPRLGNVLADRTCWWLAAVGATLALRVPVSVGDQDASLLLPLYAAIVAGAGMSLAARRRRRASHRFPRKLGVPLGAFSAWLMVSSAWSSDPGEAAVRIACYVAPFALLAWLVVDLWPAQGGPTWLAGGFGAMAVGAAAVAIGQAVAGRTFGNDKLAELHAAGGMFRANGPLHDPNMLGRILAVALILALAAAYLCAARGEGRRSLRLVAGGMLLIAGLMLTASQSSGLALVAGVGVLLMRGVGWRRVLAVMAVAGVALIAWGAFGSDPVHDAVSSRERIARASDGRDRLVAGGIAVWRDHPLAGSGLGSFADRYRAGLDPAERERAALVTSHTAPVTVLVEGGIVGLGLLVWVAVAAIRVLGRRGRAGWARWALLATLAAVAVHSLLYAALVEDPLTWVALAAGAALTLAPRERPPAPAAAAVRACEEVAA